MNSQGKPINIIQINSIKKIASQYDIGNCIQCANKIKYYLKVQNIKGKHLRIETISSHGLMGIIYDDQSNQQIATNGYHEGILVIIEKVETVFDNLYPQGKILQQWFNDFVVIPGNELTLKVIEQF